MIHEIIDHSLGVAENDAQLDIVEIDQAGEQLNLHAAVHFVVALVHCRNRHCLLLDANDLRIFAVLADQFLDGPWHGGREEYGLSRGGYALEDELDVFAKSHVQHLVRFIEHHHLDGIKPQRAPSHVVHDPAWRADHDLSPLTESGNLAIVGLAAIDWQRVNAAGKERELVDLLGNLDGQFAGRAKDQDLDGLLAGIDDLDGWDGEGGGFA